MLFYTYIDTGIEITDVDMQWDVSVHVRTHPAYVFADPKAALHSHVDMMTPVAFLTLEFGAYGCAGCRQCVHHPAT